MAVAYPLELRESLVSRMLAKELSVAAASEQYQISVTTLYKWIKKATNDSLAPKKTNDKSESLNTVAKLHLPKTISYLKAYEAINAMKFLDEASFGKYCRELGITTADVKVWKKWFDKHNEAVNAEELRESRAQNAQLQKDKATLTGKIAKQEKALAKAGTMLLMSKKALALFGEKES